MVGKRPKQRLLFDVGNVFDVELDPASFYAQLAEVSQTLFKDEDFEAFYTLDNGRPSVPPSLMALATILHYHDMISDEEAINRTKYDLRWAAVLNRAAGTQLCSKSTLQLFRTHLVIHDEIRSIFQTSIDEAKRAGLLGKTLRIALDTKPILGRGAVKDTINLMSEGIQKLARALAGSENATFEEYLKQSGLKRYAEPSVKGSSDTDWSDDVSTNKLLTEIVADARQLLSKVDSGDARQMEAASLLLQILCQDIEEKPAPEGGSKTGIKRETVKDRVPSISDPEIQHGRKSASKRFDGHKADIAVDIESQIIVAVDILAGNAGDAANALSQVEQAEANTGLPVVETTGDCAYGGGETRNSFEEAGRTLYAKVPKEVVNGEMYPKSAFVIDTEAGTVTCPGGHHSVSSVKSQRGRTHSFGQLCQGCPLKSLCTTNAKGRTVSVSAHEALIQKARVHQSSDSGRKTLRERVVVEHRLARLGQLGIGQALYFGRLKTKFQLGMAAAVANLRRTWNWSASKAAQSAI